MKILHVVESLIGGPASYLEEILPYQADQYGRDNVALLVPAEQREYIASSIDCNIETYVRTGRNVRSMLALAFAIRRGVAAHRPDIVHLHSSLAGAVGRLMIRGMFSPTRIVYCAHGWSFDRPRQTVATRAFAIVERMLSRVTDSIVTISPHEDQLLKNAGFSPANIKLVVSGMKDLAPSLLQSGTTTAMPGAPLRFLFAGRFDSQKGVDLLLNEFANIEPGRVSLKLVGAKIVDTRELVIPPGVELASWVPRDAMSAILRDSDALVMPSRWEGMPLLAIEALRSGRPVICSNFGPFPFFIEDGVNGVLVDIATPGWLGRAISLLEGTDLAAMGEAARATYVLMFDPQRMNRGLAELYLSLVEQPQLRAARIPVPRTPIPGSEPPDDPTLIEKARP